MATSTSDDLASKLSAILGGPVSSLQRLTGGASRETWRFRCGDDDLVLQRVRPGRPDGLGAEPAVLSAAYAGGVPVPEVIVDGSASSELDLPFMIVRAVSGETIARKILRDSEFESARQLLPAQLGEALGLLHQVDVSSIKGLTSVDQVKMYQKVMDDLGEPHPVFDIAFRWLEQNRPAVSTSSLVHGDFRLGNMLVESRGLSAVLDWELAHIGDPMEDLGWLCVRAWRFGGSQPVAGLGEYDELFEAYEKTSGIRPNFSIVRWWEILGTVKWGIMCIVQANTHLSGVARSHELAAIGRRVCENEYDVLNLLREELS
ncbi:MAG: phosphotransferase family protein [Ilumatobacteraceae bacterium]